MKDKAIQVLINIFKVKSIVTFVAVGIFAYLAINDKLEAATTTAIIMMVFQNLFGKKDSDK